MHPSPRGSAYNRDFILTRGYLRYKSKAHSRIYRNELVMFLRGKLVLNGMGLPWVNRNRTRFGTDTFCFIRNITFQMDTVSLFTKLLLSI